MNNLPKSQEQELDDQLAEFTDLLLSTGNEVKVQEMMKDGNLAELKKSAVLMKAAARMAHPNAAASARVRSSLLKEWKQQARQPERQIFKRFNFSFPRLALAGSLAVLLILGVTTMFLPTTPPLMGTAEGLQKWGPFFVLAGILLVVVFIWLDRRR